MSCYFTVQVEVARHYRHFNAEGRVLTTTMTATPASAAARGPTRHFTNSVDELFEYSLHDLDPSDVCMSVHKADNQQ